MRVFLISCGLTLVLLLQSRCDTNPYKQGKILFDHHCANCHQSSGEATRGLIPPLAGSDYLRDNQALIPCLMVHGLNEPIVVNGKNYKQPMTPNEELNPIEVGNILNYINSAWGNDYGYQNIDFVKAALENCE